MISLVAGVFMLAWPLESLATLTRVVGHLADRHRRLVEVVSAFGIRKATKRLGGTTPAPAADSAGELTHTDFYYTLS